MPVVTTVEGSVEMPNPSTASEKPSDETTPDVSVTPENTGDALEKEDGSHGDDELDSDTDEHEELDAPKKRKGGFQRRIDRLTRQATEAQQQALYWQQQALAQAQGKAAPAEPAYGANNEKPQAEKFETHEEFVDAMVEYRLNQKLVKLQQQQQEQTLRQQMQSQEQDVWSKIEQAKRKYADFDDLVEEAQDALKRAKTAFTPEMEHLIHQSEQGSELLYFLLKHPQEAIRISKLSPIQAARHIGLIEAKLTEPSSQETPSKRTTLSSPIKPLKGSGATGSESDPNNMTYQQFKKWDAARKKR